ncbi:MAG: hypothetical protein H6R08_2248 [Proteobacteria bacterium]|nr:hypothetical protein [Pseudomonadota bacterium]
MQTNQLVLAGAVNWAHPAWQGGFYPDDLPDDWLLPYYNTQFQAVYLPGPTWQGISSATWKQWLEDTQPGFYFVLEPAQETTICVQSQRRSGFAAPGGSLEAGDGLLERFAKKRFFMTAAQRASVKWQPRTKHRPDFLRNDNLVEIEDVVFGYGARPVLKGINLTAKRGQVVAIMGSSVHRHLGIRQCGISAA